MRIAHESRQNTDRHDVTGTARHRPRSNQRGIKPPQVIGIGLCALGILIGGYVFWPFESDAQHSAVAAEPPAASATPGTDEFSPTTDGHTAIAAFAERSAYAYLRLLRGTDVDKQTQETQRHKQSLVSVGVNTDLDYGHHPGSAPEGIVPTAIIPIRQAEISKTDTKVTLNARLGAQRWIGLTMTIRDYGDQRYGLVNRPTFVPIDTPEPLVMEAYPKRRNATLEKALTDAVQDRMRTWAVETSGLGSAFELAKIHEVIISDDQPEHGPVNGLVALDWIEPISGDTFSQIYAFTAQRNGEKWSVTPNP